MLDEIACGTSPAENHKSFLVVDAAGITPSAIVNAVDGGEAIAQYKLRYSLAEGGDFVAEEVLLEVDPPVDPPETPPADPPADETDTDIESEPNGDRPGEPDSPS